MLGRVVVSGARQLAQRTVVSGRGTLVVKSNSVVASAARGAAGNVSARPISPHLTAYKFTPSMILSVLHRGTGMALTATLFGGAFGSALHPRGFDGVMDIVKKIPGGVPLAKFAIGWPLCYHTLHGVRHLFWDNAKLLGELTVPGSAAKIVDKHGMITLAASLVAYGALMLF